MFPLVEILNSSVFNNDSSFAELQSSITNFIDLSYSPDRNYEKFSLLLQHLSLWFQEFHPAFHSFTEQKALSIQSLYKQEQFILFQHVEFFDGYYKRFSTILSILHLILFHIFNNKKIKNPTFIVLDDFDVSFFSDVISNKYKLSHFLKLANQFNFFFIFCVNDKKVFSDFSGEFSTSVELIHQNNLHHYYLLNSSNNQLSHILTLIPDSERFLNGKFSNFEFKFN